MIDPQTGEVLVDAETGAAVVDPADIEKWTEGVVHRVAPEDAPADGMVKTPDAIIHDLELVGAAAGRLARIVREADRTRRALRRQLVRRTVVERDRAKGTVEDRRAVVAEALLPEQEQLDAAEVAYEYAAKVSRLVENRQTAVQTQASMVKVTYQVAGTDR